jgi:hypothetical protein
LSAALHTSHVSFGYGGGWNIYVPRPVQRTFQALGTFLLALSSSGSGPTGIDEVAIDNLVLLFS